MTKKASHKTVRGAQTPNINTWQFKYDDFILVNKMKATHVILDATSMTIFDIAHDIHGVLQSVSLL